MTVTNQSQPNSEAIERLIEDLLQASVDYERAEKFDAKYRRKDLEDAKTAIRTALQLASVKPDVAQAAPREAMQNYVAFEWPPATEPQAAKELPLWQSLQLGMLLGKLSDWRNEDHEDALTLCRSDVIAILDGFKAKNAEPQAAPLTAEFTQMLPGGKLDDSTYEKIEAALDRIEAPSTLDGKWLSLHERINALSRPVRP